MKKITEYLKRLLGFSHLELWEPGGPVLSRVLDIDNACDRTAYLYANPSRAALTHSVDDYPGFSSWSVFKKEPEKQSHSENVPWIRLPAIEKLFSRTLDQRQDRFITQKLKHSATIWHTLTICPNAMFKAFGITDAEEISHLNARIMREVEFRQTEYSEKRLAENKSVKGAAALMKMPLMSPHTPVKNSTDRKILFHTSSKELALAFLSEFDSFCKRCREAYFAWRSGDYSVEWPPGAFRPPLRPVANAI